MLWSEETVFLFPNRLENGAIRFILLTKIENPWSEDIVKTVSLRK